MMRPSFIKYRLFLSSSTETKTIRKNLPPIQGAALEFSKGVQRAGVERDYFVESELRKCSGRVFKFGRGVCQLLVHPGGHLAGFCGYSAPDGAGRYEHHSFIGQPKRHSLGMIHATLETLSSQLFVKTVIS